MLQEGGVVMVKFLFSYNTEYALWTTIRKKVHGYAAYFWHTLINKGMSVYSVSKISANV